MLTVISSALRHSLTVALGTFVTSGIMSGDQVTMITDAAVTLIGVVGVVLWSYVEKKWFELYVK